MQVVAGRASLFEVPSPARRWLVAGGSTLVALAAGGLTAWGCGAFDPAVPAAHSTVDSHHIAAQSEKAVSGPVAEALSVVRRSLGPVSLASVKRSVETTHTATTQTRVVKVRTHWVVSGMDASGELVMSVLVTSTEEAVSAWTPGARTGTLWVFPVSDPTAATESTQTGTLMITSASGSP